MKKLSHLIHKISQAVIVIVPVLAILAIPIVWGGKFQDTLPLPVFFEAKYTLILAIAGSSLVFWIALIVFRAMAPFKKGITFQDGILLIGTIIGIPMCGIYGYLSFCFPETVLSAATMDHHNYYLTVQAEAGEHFSEYILYQCNEKNVECQKKYSYSGGGSIGYAELVVNEGLHEIHIFLKPNIANELIYTYGPSPHNYTFVDLNDVGGTTFYLYSSTNNAVQEFRITKCNNEQNERVDCEVIPFEYSVASFKDAKLVNEKESKEIKLLVDDLLILTYDTAPHCLVDGCTVSIP